MGLESWLWIDMRRTNQTNRKIIYFRNHIHFLLNALWQEINLTTEDSMDIVIRAVSVAGVTSSSGAPAHHRLIITAALWQITQLRLSRGKVEIFTKSGSEPPAEEPGALPGAAHYLALDMALATLNLCQSDEWWVRVLSILLRTSLACPLHA